MTKQTQTTLNQKRNWLWEFSKKIVVTVTVIFIAVYLFSMVLMVFYPDSTSVGILIESVTKVFIFTVVSYAVKAGFENVNKIKKGGTTNYELGSGELGSDIDWSTFNSRAN